MVSLSDGAMTVEGASTYYKQHYSTLGEYYAPDETPTIGQAMGKLDGLLVDHLSQPIGSRLY